MSVYPTNQTSDRLWMPSQLRGIPPNPKALGAYWTPDPNTSMSLFLLLFSLIFTASKAEVARSNRAGQAKSLLFGFAFTYCNQWLTGLQKILRTRYQSYLYTMFLYEFKFEGTKRGPNSFTCSFTKTVGGLLISQNQNSTAPPCPKQALYFGCTYAQYFGHPMGDLQ